MSWPIDHDGTTADELPWGYTIYPSIFDDLSGYDPVVLSATPAGDGLATILVSIAPGKVVSSTLAIGTEAPGESLLEAAKKIISEVWPRSVGRSRQTAESPPAVPVPISHREVK